MMIDNKKTIGMILLEPFPEDIRIDKEAKSLKAAGYECALLCLCEGDQAREEIIDDIRVRRFNPKSRIARKLDTLRFHLSFRRPRWEKAIGDYIRNYQIDALHVHNLPLCRSSICSARSARIPVVLDFHENFPHGLQIWKEATWWRDILKAPFKNLKRWLKYERESVLLADHTIVDCLEFKRRLVDSGLPEEKISYVQNVIDLEAFDPPVPVFTDKYADRFVMIYLGVIGPQKGLGLALEALPAIVKDVPEFHLLAVGPGYARIKEELRRRAVQLGVGDNFEMLSPVPHREIFTVLNAGDIALLHLEYNMNYRASSPHKLFEYMAAGLPVIVSPAESVARIVEEEKVGVVVEYSADEMAQTVVTLAKSREMRLEMGERGKSAVQNKYNWEIESAKIIDIYEDILG